MKKYLVLLAVAVGFAANAASLTKVVYPNNMTNLMAGFPGSVYVKSITATATSSTNAYAVIYDTPTNQFSFSSPGYTNRLSYATNYISSWTDPYGVTQSWTNVCLITVTNPVAASTVSYNARGSIGAAAGTSAVYSGYNTYFENGIWATNISGGPLSVTITY